MSETGEILGVAPAPKTLSAGQRLKNILGGAAGNFVEWFDWFTYVSFAIYFSSAIFPGGDQTTQLLQVYLAFALGFIARPIGAYVMGLYSDHAGRRAAMKLSVALMCSGSLVVGLTPTFADAGILSPAILSVGRVIQGLSVGGEYGASATYISEMSTRQSRGFWSGFLYVTIIMGQLSAMLLLVAMQQFLTEAQLSEWGWRVPFLVGAVLALVVYFIRSRVHESASFTKGAKTESRSRTMMLFLKYPRETLMIILFTAAGGSGFYFFTSYMKDFLINSSAGPDGKGFGKEDAALIATGLLVCFMFLQPAVGALSDRIGRKVVLAVSFGVGAVLAYPISVALLNATSALEAFLLGLVPLVFLAGYTSISAIIKAELFPAHVRTLGVALPYAVAQAIFGGNVATTALALKKAGNETIMFVIIAVLLAVGCIVAILMRDTHKHSLIAEH
jgi:MHS family alpha-ketoglutarate permease-like MFS transporter